MSIEYIGVVFLGVSLLALLFQRPRLLIRIVLIVSLVQLGWLVRYYHAPRVLNWVSLVFGGILGIKLVLDLFAGRIKILRRYKYLRIYFYLTFVLILIAVLSDVYNGENIVHGIFQMRYYSHGFILGLGIFYYYRKRLTVHLFKRAILALALWQIPFSIAKYLLAEGGSSNTLDSVTGSFSSYGELVACQMLAIAVLLFDDRRNRSLLVKWNPYLTTVLLTVPLLLSKSRLATGYIGIIVLYSMIAPAIKQRNIVVLGKKFFPMLILGTVVVFMFIKLFWAGTYDLSEQFDPNYATNYFMQTATTTTTKYSGISQTPMGRAYAIVESYRLINASPANFLVGYGSGATTESQAIGSRGNFYQEIGPFVGLGGNELARLIMEFGMAGVFAYLIFFLSLGKFEKIDTPTASELKNLHSHIVLVLLLLSWYTITLSSYFYALVVGSFVALVQAEAEKNRNSVQEKNYKCASGEV